MLELDQIGREIQNLDGILTFLNRRRIDFADPAASGKLNQFKSSLLSIKSNLIQIRRKLNKLKASLRGAPSEHLLSMEKQVDDLHKNVHRMTREVASQELDLTKVFFATVRGVLPLTELELQLNKEQVLRIVPPEIRSEIGADLEEVEKCYSAQSYRGVMAFCGRILDVALGRKYYDVKKQRSVATTVDEIEVELSHLTLGQIASKLRNEGIIGDIPGLDDFIGLINSVRIPSLHHKTTMYFPGPDAAKGTINLTVEALKEMF